MVKTTGASKQRRPIATASISRELSGGSDRDIRSSIPEDWYECASEAKAYYRSEPLVSNAINTWRTFALGDEIRVSCDDEAAGEDAQNLFWSLGLNKVVRDFIIQMLVKGDGVAYVRRDGTGKPERVQCVNPISVQLKTDDLGTVTEAKQVSVSSTGKIMVGGSSQQLSLDRMYRAAWNVPEFEIHGQSMIVPAMESIELLRDYRRAERAIAKRWATPLRLIKVGGVYQGGKVIMPEQPDIDAVKEAIETANLRKGLVVPFWVETQTDGIDKNYNMTTQIKEVKEDILVALGMSRAIVNGDSANFATAEVAMRKMVVLLKEIKQAARDLLDWIFDPWMGSVHAGATLQWVFNDLDLTDDTDLRKAYLELYDRGLISAQSLQDRFGLDPSFESSREEESMARLSGTLKPQDVANLVTLEVVTVDEARALLGLSASSAQASTDSTISDVQRSVYDRIAASRKRGKEDNA